MIIGEDRARQLTARVVRMALDSGADTAFALLRAADEGLTRYSNDAIEMSTECAEPSLYLRTTYGPRLGAAGVNTFDDASLQWLTRRARTLAESSIARDDLPPLAPPVDSMPKVQAYHPETALLSADGRAEIIARAVHGAAGRRGVKMFGHMISGSEERAVANSEGLAAYFAGSSCRFQVSTIAPGGGAGMTRFVGRSIEGIDPEEMAQRAWEKAARFETFADVDPGEYEAILEPDATAEILYHLGYLGFGGAAHLNGSSCFSGQIGRQLFPSFMSIWEDPLRPDGMCEPFDSEGVPRRRVKLVERGIVRGAVYDLETAARAGTASTGSGLGPEGAWFTDGPYARNLVLEPGTGSREELISRVDRGILVTRLHYTRPLDPARALLTGMTRDGTFLIKDGSITAMLPNLRFTVSAVDVLSHAADIGRDLTLATEYAHMNLVPSIRTGGFRITGKTG
ncbi:MAG: metallopeptidase TldD-related protein [Bacillota bacterium]